MIGYIGELSAGSQCGTNAVALSPTMVLRRLDFIRYIVEECPLNKYVFVRSHFPPNFFGTPNSFDQYF